MMMGPMEGTDGKRVAMRQNRVILRDKVALTVFILGGPIDLLYERFMVTSHYHQSQTPTADYWYYGFLCFCAVQIYWNLYYVATADNRVLERGDDVVTSQSFGDSYKTCEKCAALQIPQSHHCKVCDVCVLRRDHHCWFAANCVGLNNQGNFFLLSFYLWLGALVENIYNLSFVCDVLGCNLYSLISICVPHFPVLIKEATLHCIFTNSMTFIGLLLLAMFCAILYIQLCKLITGLTPYERTKGITKEKRLPIMYNIKSVLGANWYISWLLPSLSPRTAGSLHTD